MSALTVGGWYGRIGVQILSGSDCVAVVGRMQANRLDALDKVRSASAKRDERAYHAEVEAQGLEAQGLEAGQAEALELAYRILACVNALAGIPTEDLEQAAVLLPYDRLIRVSFLADQAAAPLEDEGVFQATVDLLLSAGGWPVSRAPVAPSVRSAPRPFLTMRVVRGLKTLVDLGWADVARSGFPAATENDARYAKEWLGRMAAHVVEARDRRRTYRAGRAQKAGAA